MAIKFCGWIEKFEGPESLDNAQPEIPEEVLQRLYNAYNKVMGTVPKKDSQSEKGQRKII